MTFNYLTPDIVFQEVPNEISLCFRITGCKLGCKGCHSYELWDGSNGEPLTNTTFLYWLNRYQGMITTVVFMGGEWQQSALIEKLILAKQSGLKTCLYTGEYTIANNIRKHLNYLKIGHWDANLGGLDSPKTNQLFIDVKHNKTLNHLFN